MPYSIGGRMMDNLRHHGFVKWPAFVGAILLLVGLILALPAFYVSYGEFQQFEKRIDGKFASMDKGIAEIKLLINSKH